MWDTRSEVKNAATDATLRALNTCQNSDIRPFIPAVIEAIKHPEEVPEVYMYRFILYFGTSKQVRQ